MPIKLKDESGYDYNREAKKLINAYLDDVNSKGKGLYEVDDNEYERVATELRENNGILRDRIRIRKKIEE